MSLIRIIRETFFSHSSDYHEVERRVDHVKEQDRAIREQAPDLLRELIRSMEKRRRNGPR